MLSFAPLQKAMFKFYEVQLNKQDHLGLQRPSVLIWQHEMVQEDDTGKHLNAGGGQGMGQDKKRADGKQLKLVHTKHRICIRGDTQK